MSIFTGKCMYHFKLYDDERLVSLNRKEKHRIVNKAIKTYRNENPVNWIKRLSLFALVSFLPALIIYVFIGSSFVTGWLAISSFILAVKLARDETPNILPYLDKELS